MSGTNLLLDTNFAIGLLKGSQAVQNILQNRPISGRSLRPLNTVLKVSSLEF